MAIAAWSWVVTVGVVRSDETKGAAMTATGNDSSSIDTSASSADVDGDSEPVWSYIEHTSYYDGDGVAYFGPIPDGAGDVLDTPEADLWAQTGEVCLVDAAAVLSADVYVNPWSVWLDPDSDPGDDVT